MGKIEYACGVVVGRIPVVLFNPMMGMATGADGQVLFSTSLHPTLYLKLEETQSAQNVNIRLVFRIIKYPLLVAFYCDVETGIKQLSCRGWR